MRALFFIITAFTVSLSSHAAFEQLKCRSDGDIELIKKPGYQVFLRPRGGRCDIQISPKHEVAYSDNRSYIFNSGGELVSNVSFSSQIKGPNQYKLSATTGSKSFVLFPKKQEPKIFMDKATGELKVEAVNGAVFYFNPSDGLINEEKTTDYRVSQEPIKAHKAGITISSTRYPIATFSYRTGNPLSTDRNTNILVENGEKSCRVKATKLFDYQITCGTIAKCPCNGDPKRICYFSADAIQGVKTSLLNGIEIKSYDLNGVAKLLAPSCPELFATSAPKSQEPISKPVPKPAPKPTPKLEVAKKETTPKAKPDLKPAPIDLAKPRIVVSKEAKSETKELKPKPLEEKAREAQEEIAKLLSEQNLDPVTVDASDCLKKLSKYFSDKTNKKLVDEYLKIQGKIALHRIAWTVMKSSEGDARNIEEVIKELLQKRNPQLHEQFVNSKTKTRNERLLAVMTELKTESERHNLDGKSDPYTIKFGDVKMIELLVAAEKKHGRSYNDGIMDFTSIIKNSLKKRLRSKSDNISQAASQIEALTARAKSLEDKVKAYLDGIECTKAGQFDRCSREPAQVFDLGQGLSDSQAVLDAVYEDLFDKDKELKQNFKWGSYWLHVK